METSPQPASLRTALASVFPEVFRTPRSVESSIPAAGVDGKVAEAAAEEGSKLEQGQLAGLNPANAYAVRLAAIRQKYDAEAAAAAQQQQQLQHAAQQARQRELDALAANDEAYTPAWRQAGLPARPFQSAAETSWFGETQLLNPAAIIQQQKALQQKEVLQPPTTSDYCDKEADPHYFTATNNLKVRQATAVGRAAAVTVQKLQRQQQQSKATSGTPSKSQQLSITLASTSVGLRATHRGIPWSQLPPQEVSQKVAAAAARHKALARIMTPEQRESEERIIKSMYHKLSFLRNPRYPMPQATAAMLQNGLHGTSSLRLQQQQQHRSGRERSKSPSSKSSSSCQAGSLISTAAAVTNSSFLSPSDVGFCVLPATGVLFDAYEPGGMYFQTVQLQNVGDVIRGLRLLPPASRYFQVSLPRFPTAANELAPGMSAEVSVCFTPDTLGDYSDAFVVETVVGSYRVTLRGSRPHPQLNIGEELQVGNVLAGNSRNRTVEFVNTGGAGRFLVLSAAGWAAALAADQDQHNHHQQQQWRRQAQPEGKQQDSPLGVSTAFGPRAACSSLAGSSPDKKAAAAAAVALEPAAALTASGAAVSGAFTVTPTLLDLPPGSPGSFTVNFSPTTPGQHVGEFVLICDNCTVHSLKITGTGSAVDVQLVALDGRPLQDQDRQAPIWFGQINPGCTCFRKVTVQNSTQLPFPYKWQVEPLGFTRAEETAAVAGEHEPTGELNAAAAAAPGALGPAAAAAGDVGPAPAVAATAGLAALNAGDISAAGSAHTGKPIQPGSGIVIPDQKAVAACCGSSNGSWPGLDSMQPGQQRQVRALDSAVQQSTFAVHPGCGVLQPGEVVEFRIEFTPPYVSEHAASALLLVERSGDALITSITAAGNSSGSCNTIANSSHGTKAAAAITSPSEGRVVNESVDYSAGTSTICTAAVAAAESGWESVISLGLEGLATPVHLTAAPCAVVHLPGQLTVGDVGHKVLVLQNESAAAAHFSFDLPSNTTRSLTSNGSKHCQAQVAPSAAVSLNPSSGVVPSHGSVEVTVNFTGLAVGTHSEQLLCRVLHGPALLIVAKATVIGPRVAPGVPVMDFGVICMGSSHTQQLQLQNTASNCCAAWHLVHYDHEQSCPPLQLQLLPSSGVLGPAGVCSVAVTVTGSCKGSRKMILQITSSSSSSSNSNIAHRQHCFVQLLATVSEPCVVLDTYKVHLKPAYLGVQQQRSITITNTSLLPVQFSWTVQQLQWQPNGRQQDSRSSDNGLSDISSSSSSISSSSSCSHPSGHIMQLHQSCGQLGLRMVPAWGHLEPKQSMLLQLLLEPTHVGPVKLLCCCVVPNMSQLAGFVLTACVEGLQVAYQIQRPVRQGWITGMASAAGTQTSSTASRDNQLPRMHDEEDNTAAAAEVGRGGLLPAATAGPLLADFGMVAVHQMSELQLRVTNLTSIDTTLLAWMTRYPAAAAAAAAAAAVAGAQDTAEAQHLGQQQQQQLAMSTSRVQSTSGSQLGQRESSEPGQLGDSAGSVSRGLPASTLSTAAAAAPAQQQQAAVRLRHVSSSGKSSSSSTPQQRCCAVAPQQRQQLQQQPSIAARLAAAVSGSSKPGPLSLKATNLSATVTSTSSSSSSGVTQLQGPLLLPGPFRSAAGNSMMAARNEAAAAAAALGEGLKGCAICIEPNSSTLPGWDSVDLQLLAYNNLPGTYVDYLCVQVGELPVRRIPTRVCVVGSPLVVSKERVLLQGLQTLLALQHTAAGIGAHATATKVAAAAAAAADDTTAAGCWVAEATSGRSVSAVAKSSSRSMENLDGVTTVQLALGVMPVGVQHERTFYVVNTGPLPMQLSWHLNAADAPTALPPVAAAAAVGKQPADDLLQVDTAGSSSEQISCLPFDRTPDALELGSSAQLAAEHGTCTGVQEEAAAAGNGTKASADPAAVSAFTAKGRSKAAATVASGRASATGAAATAGGSAAAAGKGPSAAGSKSASPAVAVGAKRLSGGGAAAGKQPPRDSHAAAAAAAEAEQQLQQQQGQGPASLCTTISAGQQGNTGTTSAVAAPDAETEAKAAATAQAVAAVPDYEQLLPSGGPSSLLKTLQAMVQQRKQQQQQQQQQELLPAAGSCETYATTAAADSSCALEAFTVEPQQCILPAGEQQKFAVTFSSWHTGVHTVNLIGQQAFAHEGTVLAGSTHAAASNDEGSNPGLTLMLWPRQQEVAAAVSAAAAPLELVLSGGFHAHAAVPLKPMPSLQVLLSATAVAAQLTPNDPSRLSWSCCSIHDISNHSSYRHTVTLCNTAGCPLVFQLMTEEPFSLVSAVPSVPQNPIAFRG